MAELIPSFATCDRRFTTGERRFAKRLLDFLEDDYLVWFDIPLGKKRRYPDFVILHPGRGLLLLEVKDWKLDTLVSIDHHTAELQTMAGRKLTANPIEQARQCSHQVVNQLQRDPALRQTTGKHSGNLACPYGYGTVLTNITRAQLNDRWSAADQERVLPPHQVICKDEMTEGTDPEAFQEKLWGMFNYRFDTQLSLPQIDRIRWHLFPELRLESGQLPLNQPSLLPEETIPDIIRILDLGQEQLARSLGEGHRVVHGVAGSGKTLLLAYRCLYLSQSLQKPILVLCFNITLAARLRTFIADKGIAQQVQVYHFHDWVGEQLRRYNVDLKAGTEPVYERQVSSLVQSVARGQVPSEQYGAVMIDEGHDFEPDWLRLVVRMVDSSTDSLLLLYDDAQSIYKRNAGLPFTLSSVDVQARGRTTVLKLNYRNTREILDFAWRFAAYTKSITDDEDQAPLVQPEAAGNNGPAPAFRRCAHSDEEDARVRTLLMRWQAEGSELKDIAVLCPTRQRAEQISKRLEQAGLPVTLLASTSAKRNYNAENPSVAVLTWHSSKGLEFDSAVVMGAQHLPKRITEAEQAKVLYVAMTRAKRRLVVTASGDSPLCERLEQVCAA